MKNSAMPVVLLLFLFSSFGVDRVHSAYHGHGGLRDLVREAEKKIEEAEIGNEPTLDRAKSKKLEDEKPKLVTEDEVLMEEVLNSARGDYRDLFDSDAETKENEKYVEGERRVRRQVDKEDIRVALCKDRNPGDYFRLVAGSTHCRDVVACADEGLQAIRCPPGLAFSLAKLTCDWKASVEDCGQKSRPKLALPLLNTKEPLCPRGELACGDGQCLPRELFCDEKPDCKDGSDENLCDARNDPNRAADCNPQQCKLPNCFCSESGQEIPGGLDPERVPQMILLTFDDAVNVGNFEIFDEFLDGQYKNPNGCDIKATFFLSHQYTNYSMVQELYRRGHEIAVHSISHNNEEKYWGEGSFDTWSEEMGGAKEIISEWANIPVEDIYGARAPLLRLGGNPQFSALENEEFLYDSSVVAPLTNPPYWPYPLSFASPHRCHGNVQKCPTRSHGVMEMVMNEFDPREEPGYEDEQVIGCSMIDSCSSIRTPDILYNVLTHNFIRHYEQNRAPMGVFLHAAWLKKSPEMNDALQFWMEEILATYDDVYFVTMSQALSWMQEPVRSDGARNFPSWTRRCNAVDTEDTCHSAHNCVLPSDAHAGVKLRMQTCNSCPAVFPWLNNPKGLDSVELV